MYEKGGEYFVGDKPIGVTEDQKFINISGEEHLLTQGLWDLLTSKEYDSKTKASDISTYRKILEKTNTMYVNNDPKSGKLKPINGPKLKEKWSIVIEPAWSNLQKEKRQKQYKGKKGSGVKKVVIPCDPNALLEKLDLLMASKAAGNTGVRNELVSVCDELKRQGIFDSKSYKKIMSLLKI